MRIISGALKGRKLSLGKTTGPARPMTDRVKETVFNVLAPYFFENCLFLDLFSGTGNLAFEALSRGARQAHAVEKSPLCAKIIKNNSQLLGLAKKLILHKKNVFSFLNQASKDLGGRAWEIKPFDIITAGPPFAIQAGDRIMEGLQNSFLTAKGAVAVIETASGENLKTDYFNCYLFSKKTFGDKKVWFYEFKRQKK